MMVAGVDGGKPPGTPRQRNLRLLRRLGFVLAFAHLVALAIAGSTLAASDVHPSRDSAAGEPAVLLRAVRLGGVTVFDEKQLEALYADAVGDPVSFADLEDIAGRITRYYRSQGYFLARAHLPAQTIEDGRVHIAVVEGRYGAIRVDNRSALKPSVADSFLSSLRPGDVIHRASLDRALLLLNDLPGVTVTSSLEPGAQPGHSDLVVRIDDAKRWHGRFTLNNFGHPLTGRGRGEVTVSSHNATGRGDRFYGSGLLSEGGGLREVQLGYTTVFGPHAVELDASVRSVSYKLGGNYSLLDAKGDKVSGTVAVRYPMLRASGRTVKLFSELALHDFKDHWLGATTKKEVQSVAFGMSGSRIAAPEALTYTMKLTLGSLEESSDLSPVRARGGFGKVDGEARYTRWTSQRTRWNFLAKGQIGLNNLDSSEKFSLGGSDGVRAYPRGEARGDTGALVSVAFSHSPAWLDGVPGTASLQGFVDAGFVKRHLNPGPGDDRSYRKLAGAGLGVHWAHDKYSGRLEYACKLGSGRAQSVAPEKDRPCQLWAQVALSL